MSYFIRKMGDLCSIFLPPNEEIELTSIKCVQNKQLFAGIENVDQKTQLAIIKKIGSFLPTSDALRLHGTNRIWRSALQSRYFYSSCVVFKTGYEVDQYTREILPFVHSSFIFKSFTTSVEGMGESRHLANFFNKYGPQICQLGLYVMIQFPVDIVELQSALATLKDGQITKLNLHLHFWTNVFPLKFNVDSLGVLNSLKKLRIVLDCHVEVGSPVDHDAIMERISSRVDFSPLAPLFLGLAPNVESLTVIDVFGDLNPSFHNSLFRMIKDNNQILPCLDEIRIQGSENTPGQLKSIKTPLKKISILFENSEYRTWEDLQQFLEVHSETLEDLRLDIRPDKISNADFKIGLRFPKRMSKLKNLELAFITHNDMRMREHWDVEFPMEAVNYPEMFPALDTLTLFVLGNVNDDFQNKVYEKLLPDLEGEEGICTSLENLRLQYRTKSGDLNQLKKTLLKLFPNACKDGIPPPLSKDQWVWMI